MNSMMTRAIFFALFFVGMLINAETFGQVTIVSQDFEANDGGWAGGNDFDWTGDVDNTFFDTGNSTEYWYNVDDNSDQVLTSPSFDFTGITNMTLSIRVRYDLDQTDGGTEEGFNIEYSTNGGGAWTVLGALGDGTNWYNNADVDGIGGGGSNFDGWTDDNAVWETASITLPGALENQADVQFRINFGDAPNETPNGGLAFDDFLITRPGQEINLIGNSVDIADGDNTPSTTDDTDFGASSVIVDRIFTIENEGDVVLNLDGTPIVDISGDTEFSILTQPVGTTVAISGGTQTFEVRFDPGSIGVFTATISIDSDDSDEDPYTFDVMGSNGPDINLQGNGASIASGDVTPDVSDDTDFGNTNSSVARTFTIQNAGNTLLTLSQNPSVSGSAFSITDDPNSLTINDGNNETFEITFTPSGFGTFTETVTITSDDVDEASYTFAITGTNRPSPGDLTSGVALWLKADADADNAGSPATEGQEVDSWLDGSANAFELTDTALTDAATDGGPAFRINSGLFNGNPSLEFNNGLNDENLAVGSFNAFPTDALTIITVQNTSATNNGHLIGYVQGTSDQLNISQFDDLAIEIQDDDINPGSNLSTGISSILAYDLDGSTTDVPSNTYVNGGSSTLINVDAGNTRTFLSNGTFNIGQEIDNETAGNFGANQDFRGEVAEVLLFDGVLAPADRRDVETYLAIKYGITLDIASTGYTVGGSDVYAIDATFDNDIAGIGQDDSQGLDQITSQSVNASSVISIGAATDRGDGEFLIWGHNGGNATDLTGDYDGSTNNGLPRIWKVQETGEVGTVTITVTKTDINASVNAIYVNTEATLASSGGEMYGLVDGGAIWSVTIDLNDGEYFTFVQSSVPNISLSGNSVTIANGETNFGLNDDRDYGTLSTGASETKTFTINNFGAGNLTLENTFVTLTGSSDFSLVGQPSTPVAALGSVTFQITFSPSAALTRSATVIIDSDDPNDPFYTFTLTGLGAIVSEIQLESNSLEISSGDVSPSALDNTNFGTVAVGNTLDKDFTINNLGNADLVLDGASAVTITGSTAFTIETQPSTPISSVSSSDFTIRFAPVTAGVKAATVTIENNDPNEDPYTFQIQGAASLTSGGSEAFSCNCLASSNLDPVVSTAVVLNDYFPGTADALSGSLSINLGARRAGAAGTTLEVGDVLMIIQMQGAEIDATLPDEDVNDPYGDGAGGNDRKGYLDTEDFTAGQYEYVVVEDASAYDESTGGLITIKLALNFNYYHEITNANFTSELGRQTFQVVKVANYNDLTITSSGSITTPPWNGRSGGMVVIDALTSLTIDGTINADYSGFRGGFRSITDIDAAEIGDDANATTAFQLGFRGEGIAGTPRQIWGYNNPPLISGSLTGTVLAESGYAGGSATLTNFSSNPNPIQYLSDKGHGAAGNAGGAGRYDGSGGGGANGGDGGLGGYPNNFGVEDNRGVGADSLDLSGGRKLFLGGGGGSGGFDNETGFTENIASGHPGGGIVLIRANDLTGTGSISVLGSEASGTQAGEASGGGGAGGTVVIVTDTEDITSITINATGGDGGATALGNDSGGGGGSGGNILLIRRGGNFIGTPTVTVDGGVQGGGGAGAEEGTAGNGGFEVTSLPPPANLDCPLINRPDIAPGGVAGTRVWIRADADVTFDGDNQVSQWIDQSANGFVFDQNANDQLTTTGSTPDFSDNLEDFNFNPAIDFNNGGTSDYLGFTGYSNFPTGAMDVFVVARAGTSSNSETIISFIDNDGDVNDYNLELNSSGEVIQRIAGTEVTLTNIADGTGIRDDRSRIINTRYLDGNDDTEVFIDNQSLVTNTIDATLDNGNTDATFVLGQDLDNLTTGGFQSGEAFVGQISEVIMYPSDLTDDQRRRVDTYLAIKYGITLFQDQDYLNSISETIFPGSTETEYDNNIAGVGRDDGSGLVQLRSKSINDGAILTGSASSFAVDRSFVVWGSNGVASPAFAATNNSPVEATDTLSLHWKAYVSNDPGPIDLSFNLSGITNQPASNDVLGLLIDEDMDGDFTTGTIRVIPYQNYDGTTVTFDDVEFNDGEVFTIGVLPIAPGGVSANLSLWNKADTGTRNDGGDVTTGTVDEWVDQSQASNTVTGDGATEPELVAADSSFNFNQSLDFSGGHLFGSTPMNTNSDGSTFLIGNKNTLAGTDVGIGFDDGGSATASDPGLRTDGTNLRFTDDNSTPANFDYSAALSTETTYLAGTQWTNGTNQTVDLRLNGLGETLGTLDLTSGTDVTIGAEADGDNRWDGNIAEVVVYTEDLTDNDLQKVESYLAIKYGITLDQTTPRDYLASNSAVVFPATSSNPDYITYAMDIAAIGRDDQSTLDQRKSLSVNSDAIVTITNGNDPDVPAAFSNNFTFLAWGNDNDDNGTIEEVSTELAPNVTARLDREWRAAVTGNLGEVTLQFDLSGITGVGSDFSTRTVADFKVQVDKNGDFTDGFIQSFDATSFDPVTEIVTVTGVTLADDDIFTLSTAVPAKGPGGVTTGLQLWLRADIGAYQNTGASVDSDTDGDQVFRWDDQVSSQQYTNDVFGGNSSPTFRTDIEGFNFNPAIQFVNDGTADDDDYLANAGSNIWGSDLTLLGVFQTDGDDGTVFSYDDDGSDATDEFALNNLGQVELEVDENTVSDFNGQNIADNTSHIFAFDYSDAGNSTNLYIDGAADPSNSGTLTAGPIADGGTAVIGQDINDISGGGFTTGSGGPGYDDYIGELIVYDQVLSETDRQKIQTYLGLKYGIFVDDGNPDFLSADGTVVYPGGESVFNNDIAGVGRDDLGNFLQPKSKSNESTATLTMEKNEDFNADGQYIVWSHNGQSSTDSTSLNLPSGIESRMARVWRVDLTNSPSGTVDLTFEVGGNPADVRLLFDAIDPTFGSATIINPTVVDNMDGTFTFQNVNVSNFTDGGYFTVGSVDKDETPLPVELLYFVGVQEADQVQLDWATATEINNDHFEVQKSLDGETWEVIGVINGFGTTNTQQDYIFTDVNPHIGVAYYRLRQVDFDGAFEHSEIVQISYRFEDFDFNFFPNPFTQNFTINIKGLSANERMPYRIVNLSGAVLQEGTFVSDENGRFRRQATITGDQASGIYFFHVIREGQPIIYKLIKK
ncbi:MAG: choice-of-anchor D domain-containing protein [Cyclobacteriaceae bacterium]